MMYRAMTDRDSSLAVTLDEAPHRESLHPVPPEDRFFSEFVASMPASYRTAFDQAGKGTGSEASLLDAIDYAAKMAVNR